MSRLEEALRLECHVLGLVLQRNHKQHHRTQYFRRIDMIHRAIQRHSILLLTHDVSTLRQSMSDGKAYNSVIPFSQTEKPNQQLTAEMIDKMYKLVHQVLPEIISRIMHAASSLFMELGRGFFVPLCSVLLAITSRIRVILMRLGREAVLLLQQQNYTVQVGTSWDALLQPFLEMDGSSFNKWKRKVSTSNLQLLPMTVEKNKPKEDMNFNTTTVDSDIQELISDQDNFISDDMDIGQDFQVGKSSAIHSYHILDSPKEPITHMDRNEHMVSYVQQKHRKGKVDSSKIIEKVQSSTVKKEIKESSLNDKGISHKRKKRRDKILDDIFD